MRAVLARHDTATTDRATFEVIQQPDPEPGALDLLVRVVAIGMNPVDTKARVLFGKDGVLGWDACGVVETTGPGVAGFAPGDRIYYAGDITRPGCNSELHLVDHRIAANAPKSLSPEDAAAMPLTTITAWEGLFDRLGFVAEPGANTGRRILVIGGAGGVGSVAIQLARWSGLHVIATASRPATVAWCRKLGAHDVVNHGNALDEELRALSVDGVDAVFCTTQTERHWEAMAACVHPQGRVVLIDDPFGPLDLTLFKTKSVTLAWEFMYTRSMYQTSDIGEQGQLLTVVAGLLDAGTIVSTRQDTLHGLTAENIQAMHVRQESGAMMGKQVLVV